MIRVVHEDDDLLAVDKPEGVPAQAADPAHRDDLPFRLQQERDLAYLGTHQRLDKDTSGVLVYAKTKAANKGLAEQLERRRVTKRYVALVEGWRGGPRRLEHHLARGDGGRTVVSSPRDRRAKRAITHVERVERQGARALLELRIETGRTHQIRAQLAHEGAPLIGDTLYGGAPGPRLMLHSRSLSLRHPIDGRALELVAPVPALFGRWLSASYDPFEPASIRETLARATERRWGLARREDLSAYRLVNASGDGLPGVAVDVYAEWLVLHLYDEGLPHEATILDALADAVAPRGVYVKRRPKQANVIVAASETHAPAEPVFGTAAPSPLPILEHGVPLLSRLDDGLSTGVFLDQRHNRARVRELSADARVLNLFAYTCPFTVAAGLGGARSTLSIDASARALEHGRANLEHAGLDASQHRLERADCFDALRRLAERTERFDLVICDPPTYSTTKSTRWKSGKAWRGLARLAFSVLAPGGKLLLCSNDRRMSQRAFRRHVRQAADDERLAVGQLKDLSSPPDFPGDAQPKGLLCTLR